MEVFYFPRSQVKPVPDSPFSFDDKFLLYFFFVTKLVNDGFHFLFVEILIAVFPNTVRPTLLFLFICRAVDEERS